MFDRYRRKRRMARGVELEDYLMTATEKEKAIIETPYERRPVVWLWYAGLMVLSIFFLRISYLSLLRGEYYNFISKGNRVRSTIIKAPRGKIFDKFGQILASNIPSVDVIAIPRDLPTENEQKKQLAETLGEILSISSDDLLNSWEKENAKSLDPILVKENITRDQALILSEKTASLPGIELDPTARRNYENGQIFSQVLGYDGKITQNELANHLEYSMTDYIGKTGLEKYYESDLRGINGAKQMEVDSLGNIKKDLGTVDPQSGNDLVLNIDKDLQEKLYNSISEILEKTKTKTAAAVAINPKTGGVLAMVSFPSFDNNLFAQGISQADYKKLITDSNLPLFNRVIDGEYPPGSTIKPAVAAAALSEKTITPETIIDGLGGHLHIGNFSFGDWKAHEPSNVVKAIAQSNDVFFYTVGGGYGNIEGLGMSRMKKYENLFGFGSPTGVDLPGESNGFIPDEQWKMDKLKEKWYVGDSYHCAIGQGFVTATPLQLANYISAIANGGTLFEPHIVNQIKKSDGEIEEISPKIIRQNFIDSNVMQIIREGMRQVVTDGTAQSLKTLSVAVAGKTGTAEFGSEGKTHAWFVSFAPYDNPEIAMVVLLEGGGEGSSSSVPVTKEVLDWYFKRDKK